MSSINRIEALTDNYIGFETLDNQKIGRWLKRQVGDKPIILPYSGGLDSSVILALLLEHTRKDNIRALHFSHPAPEEAQRREYDNAEENAVRLGARLEIVEMRFLYEAYAATLASLGDRGKDDAIQKTIASSRIIDMFVRNLASRTEARLVGTLDLTEILTGYHPKEANAGDFLPLGGLFRTEIRKLGEGLGIAMLPESYSRVPGCGALIEDVRNAIQSTTAINLLDHFPTEDDLDQYLLRILAAQDAVPPELRAYLEKNFHKSRIDFGRPIFMNSDARSKQIEGLLNSMGRS